MRDMLTSQIHMVNFDDQGKIQQIRQHWDQGSLLKLIDVIGRTGRNWPLRDGKDQIKLSMSSVKAAGMTPGTSKAEPAARVRNDSNVTRDPHASLSLFAPREEAYADSLPAAVPHRASARPTQRDYHDLFVGNDSDNSTPGTPHMQEHAIAPKGGASKNYAPGRLFDHQEPEVEVASPQKTYNGSKYSHFDFGDGTEDADAPKPSKAFSKSKHDSQWDFEDFNTPAKPKPGKYYGGARGQDVRHWGNEEDEVLETPIHHKKIDKPRKDAETHFELMDDGGPDGGAKPTGRINRGAGSNKGLYQNNVYEEDEDEHPAGAEKPAGRANRGAGQNKGLGLYSNNVYDEDEDKQADVTKPKADTIANTKDRRKDFDAHFSMADESPVSKPKAAAPVNQPRQHLINSMNSTWQDYDESPRKENAPPARQVNKAPQSDTVNVTSGGRVGLQEKKQTGIVIGGDGMGGRIGASRQWGFGDDSEGEEAGGVKGQTRTMGKGKPTGGDFWDF